MVRIWVLSQSLWLLELCQRTAVSPHSYGFWFSPSLSMYEPNTYQRQYSRSNLTLLYGLCQARAFTRSEDRIPETELRYMIHRSMVLEPNVEFRISGWEMAAIETRCMKMWKTSGAHMKAWYAFSRPWKFHILIPSFWRAMTTMTTLQTHVRHEHVFIYECILNVHLAGNAFLTAKSISELPRYT